jgi:hypothetical protein
MSNFGFLEKSEPHLHLIASRIERYLEDDPVTAIVKVRAWNVASRYSLSTRAL